MDDQILIVIALTNAIIKMLMLTQDQGQKDKGQGKLLSNIKQFFSYASLKVMKIMESWVFMGVKYVIETLKFRQDHKNKGQ